MWASEDWTAPFSLGPIEDRSFCAAPSPLSRNSRSFNARWSVSTSGWGLCQASRGSAVYEPRPDSPSLDGWQGSQMPSRDSSGNRTASKEQAEWLFTPLA
jgi:hypothetical protein